MISSDDNLAEIVALADALRTPLLQLRASNRNVQSAAQLEVIIASSLRDIDALIMSLSIKQTALSLETLSLGSIIKDVCERMRSFAKMSGVSLVIEDRASHQPVLGYPKNLLLGLELVTKTICEIPSDYNKPVVVMRADTRHGYPRLGVYRKDVYFSSKDVTRALRLVGGARVNAGVFQQLGALRIAVASRLLESLELQLRYGKANHHNGFALQLQPSNQINLF